MEGCVSFWQCWQLKVCLVVTFLFRSVTVCGKMATQPSMVTALVTHAWFGRGHQSNTSHFSIDQILNWEAMQCTEAVWASPSPLNPLISLHVRRTNKMSTHMPGATTDFAWLTWAFNWPVTSQYSFQNHSNTHSLKASNAVFDFLHWSHSLAHLTCA